VRRRLARSWRTANPRSASSVASDKCRRASAMSVGAAASSTGLEEGRCNSLGPSAAQTPARASEDSGSTLGDYGIHVPSRSSSTVIRSRRVNLATEWPPTRQTPPPTPRNELRARLNAGRGGVRPVPRLGRRRTWRTKLLHDMKRSGRAPALRSLAPETRSRWPDS